MRGYHYFCIGFKLKCLLVYVTYNFIFTLQWDAAEMYDNEVQYNKTSIIILVYVRIILYGDIFLWVDRIIWLNALI